MSQQTRIYRLIQLLGDHPEISLDELAAALGCPASIIRGDLQQLRPYRKD